MNSQITLKSNGEVSERVEADRLLLSEPSVVTFSFGPEQVARFDRVGNDLILILQDGSRIVVENFFVAVGEERSDIVFIDGNEVAWWGQYNSPWAGFDIAEIERGLPPPAYAFAGFPGLLGLLAGGAALAGGGSDPNRPPVATNDIAPPVVEAGVGLGGNTATPGTPQAVGNVLTNDSDPDGNALTVTGVSIAAGAGTPGQPLQGLYGTLVLNADGSYTYTLDNSLPATQALAAGAQVDEVFTYTISDGQGGTASATLTIPVQGSNDIPVIAGGAQSGTVTEAGGDGNSQPGTSSASGTFVASDVDSDGGTLVWAIEGTPDATYGDFSLDANGNWQFTLDNARPATEALRAGETVTLTYQVRVSDIHGAFAVETVTITLTGSNDTPVIDSAGSNLAGAITEITDGAAGENATLHAQDGTIRFSDVDAFDGAAAASFVPVVNNGSYLGTFALSPVSSTNDAVQWSFTVDDALLDSLPAGAVLTQDYLVTITDAQGATVTETVTITLTGSNDRPEAADDSSITSAGGSVVRDVLANDRDVDTGDTARWSVVSVDGQVIGVGQTITLSGGRGTVALDGAGRLTYEPGPGAAGQIVLPYVVNDGSGAANATATADWTITVVGVDISDNASPADPAVGDNVLAAIDDIANVEIKGHAPTDGTITALTISDGTNTVIVPPGAITVNPDGSFSVHADLTGLSDGPLTVTLTVTQPGSAPVTVTDTILKDTATTVTIDPVLVVNGTIPTITGTGEPGATVTLDIGGSSVTVTVEPDGTWSHTPATPLPEGSVTISATAEDRYGNTATITRDVAGLELKDEVPGESQHIEVSEAGLPTGSDPAATNERAQSSFTIGSGVDHVVIGGALSGGAITGGTTITLAQLQDLATTPIPPIPTEYGTLTITGYDPATGVVSYSYDLSGNTTDHSATSGNDRVEESITIAVVDSDGDTRVDTLVVAVVDDVPVVATGAGNPVLETDEGNLATAASASFADLFTINYGADGAASGTAVVYALEVSAPGAGSGLVDTATGSAIVLYVEAGQIVGRVGDGSGPIAFTVAVDAATGVVTLDQQRAIAHPAADDVVSVLDAVALLKVTVTDGDGDTVSQTAPIGNRLTFRDDTPVAEDDSVAIPAGSYDVVSGNVLTGLGAGDVADTLGVDGGGITQVTFGSGAGMVSVTVPAGAAGATIQGTYGKLTLHADGSYSYARDPASAGGGQEVFTYTLTDGDGDTATATLTVDVGNANIIIDGLANTPGTADVLVNESKLTAGTGVGSGGTVATGSFTVTIPDGATLIRLTVGGADYDLVVNNSFNTPAYAPVTTPLGNVLTIETANLVNGKYVFEYSYTLSDNEAHSPGDGRNSLFEDFTVTAIDMDGDNVTGTLRAGIIDDAPVIALTQANPQIQTFERDAPNLTASSSFKSLFAINFGADGAASANAEVYSLAVSAAGVDSGLIDTATGSHVLLYLEGGAIIGRVGDSTGPVALTVTVDSATGLISLQQGRSFSHPAAKDLLTIVHDAILLHLDAADADGDTIRQSTGIGDYLGFIDSEPTAADDRASVPQGSYAAVSGNVLTGLGAGDLADSPGADGGRVTQVSFGSGAGLVTETVPAGTTDVTIQGAYGVLSIRADGSYSYARDPGTAGGHDDVFTYTLTDGDGDTATATLTVSIANASVSISGLLDDGITSDITVNESKLTGGTGVGSGAVTASGTFTIAAEDGIEVLKLTQGGTDFSIVLDNITQAPLTITTALGNTLTVSYDATTGTVSYSYTLNANETHAAGNARNELIESFGVSLTDKDGDTVTSTLLVGITDDIPVITIGAGNPQLVVDESDLSTNDTTSFAGLFDIDFGADGPATGTSVVYALTVDAAIASGLIDTATGLAVVFTANGDGTVITGSAGAGGPAVVTITIDSTTGAVTLDQIRAVQHPTSAPDETVTITDGALQVQVTVTDSDGDSVSESRDIGNRFSLRDDAPTASLDPDPAFVLPTLITRDINTLGGGTDTASGSFGAAFTPVLSYGADGASASNANTMLYALSLQGGTASVASGLSSGGNTVTLFLVGGQIIGSTATTAADVTTANTVFSIEIGVGGGVSLTQRQPIDHGDPDNSAEVIALADGLIQLTGTLTVQDRDGDSATDSSTISIGSSFRFTDTGPVTGATTDTSLDESALRGGGTTAVSQALNASVGAEQIGSSVAFAPTTIAQLEALGLKSGGATLQYTLVGTTITASTGAGAAVFTVALEQPSGTNGYTPRYTFTLAKPLDHLDGTTPTAVQNLALGYLVTDADGDSAAGSFTVSINDDVPTAVDQTPLTVAEGGTAIVGTGLRNLLWNDTQGADGARIHQVRYLDDTGTAVTVTIPEGGNTGLLNTQYGTLIVLANGNWSFTPDGQIAHVNGAPVAAGFIYNLIDSDGDVSNWANQPIAVTDTVPVATNDPLVSIVEGSDTPLTGNVIGNDIPSRDGIPQIYSFTYGNLAGVGTTYTFVDPQTSVTVQTPTGALTVDRNGSWSFAPVDSYDHDAPGANRESGSFSYVLVDSDGSRSNTVTQPIRVTDTNPTVRDVSLSLDEKNIPSTGSAGLITLTPVVQPLLIDRSEDAITDVVFTGATITGLEALNLTSGGAALSYALYDGGHLLVAYIGGGNPVFTLRIGNPDDPTGLTQNITAQLSRPLDHDAGNGTNILALPIAYQVHDIDSVVDATLTLNVIDDIPAVPVNDTPVLVTEGGAAAGSAGAGANLLANDVKGADGGYVYDITYTDRAGATQTNVAVPAAGLEVETRFGTLTVNRDGSWSYEPVETAHHQQPDNNLTLRDDFTYRVIDGDGDISAGSATQQITVSDTVPEIGTPQNGTVDEKFLPAGSTAGGGPLSVTGSLDLKPGKDSFAVTLSLASLPTGLTSGGLPVHYALSTDKTTITAHTGTYPGETVFTLSLTNGNAANAGYSFVLVKALDHDGAANLPLTFAFSVTDSDGDSDSDSFSVTVVDDAPADTFSRTISEDNPGTTFNTSADANPANTTIYKADGSAAPLLSTLPDGRVQYKIDHGTVTVNLDGSITYRPDPNYSGTEKFLYKTVDGATTTTTEVTMQVDPVSDAPTLGVVAANINTPEDTTVALGLKAPVILDNGSGTGNNPESERIGAVTLSGLRPGAVLLDGSGATLLTVPATGVVTVVLSNVATVAGTTGMLTMTAAEFEALQIQPPTHDATNFTVTVSVTSHEVDSAGAPLAGVPGAQSTATVKVHVQAVTDDVALVFDTTTTKDAAGVDKLVFASTTVADATLAEDKTFDLRSLLSAGFADLDGSEMRSITVTNGSGHAILVNGQTVVIGGTSTIFALPGTSGQTGGIDSFPAITIGGVGDFSGDLSNIGVRINAQDMDADGYWTGTSATGTNVPGVIEANTLNNSVTLNLHVTPVAGDVSVAGVTTREDTAVAFLQNISVTDTGTDTGTEVITSVSFTVPSGWNLAVPTISNGATWIYNLSAAGVSTITFTGGTEAQRELVLDAFLITPPAHSSRDANIPVTVTTLDSNTVDNAPVSDSKTSTHDLWVRVTPVAEVIGPDLSMTPGHTYATEGREDQWFTLGTEGTFDLRTGWTNQDGDELTYARLTPELMAGDGSQVNAIGTEFRWLEGGVPQSAIYDGTPVDVPVSALHTLEFRPVKDFSGLFRIKVQAHTVDYDDDTEGTGTPAEATTGEAILANLLILPVADDVALTLNARANGFEDTAIALSIRPSSSDPSETFTVTIGDIPVGATITYGSQTFTATPGNTSFEIAHFSRTTPLAVTPPHNSNEDFVLSVKVVSVDTLTVGGTTVTDISDPVTLDLNVIVKGVADEADVTTTPQTYTEAALDSGSAQVKLADLVTAALTDTDGSEALTIRVTGLPAGFAPVGGTLVSPPGDSGAARVWLLTEAQLATASIRVPANYSGTVAFSVTAVTTETDGNSLTGTPHAVSFTVTPSPEATVTTSAELVEDVLTSIGFGIQHQNGDLDERLGNILIRETDAATTDFTLYLGTGTGAKTLAEALADGEISTTTIGGAVYYQLDAAQAGTLAALTGAHLDAVLGGFNLKYQVIDDSFGSQPAGSSTTGDYQDAYFTLTATPVTDQPVVSITAISGSSTATTIVSDVHTGDDATPDTATLSATDIVTVRLNVASPDHDGSEHLIRIIIDNVPAGVTVIGAEPISPTTWLLVYEAGDAKSIDAVGGIAVDLQFEVGPEAYGISGAPIRITAQVQDRGDQAGSETAVRDDSVSWTLVTTYPPGAPGIEPATIEEWQYNGAVATEDSTFKLSEVITAAVNVSSTAPNIFTVRLENLPPGTVVTGMIRTVIDGKEVWTASITSAAGSLPAATEALLANLMDSITITPPAHWNDNNAPGGLEFSATLTTAVKGGREVEQAVTLPEIPVTPVTDEADITIALDPSVGPDGLDEADGAIPLSLTITNTADGAAGEIVGETLYLQIAASRPELAGGTLTVDGVVYSPVTVTGVDGITNGIYYVIPDVEMGDTLDLLYTPTDMVTGSVTVSAWVRNDETGAAAEVTSTGSLTVPIRIGNDGVTVTTVPTTGPEATDASNNSLIELKDIVISLDDNDGSERIVSILLSNLPDGFLILTGDSAGTASAASLASNAGGTSGTNTWVLSKPDGSLPDYIGILPPKNWSGTLSDLVLYVTSGESSLDESLSESFPLAPVTVTPVANGITLAATNTFGAENSIVSFNLNASIRDPQDASVTSGGTVIAADQYVETATIELKGLGANASFYVDGVLRSTGVTYNVGTDTYRLTGLSQSDLDDLGFMQARNALTDQASAAGTQVAITAWTVDGTDVSAPVSSTVTVNLSAQLPTTGNDSLIWTGTTINARAGEDTLQFRYGQSLAGTDLAQHLRNIEVLDLSIAGTNTITGLTPAQVAAMTDADRELTILGTAEDLVSLSGNWHDNNDGSYTGTVGSGASATQVTLNIASGIDVTPPAGGFSATSGLMSGLRMSAGFASEDEGLGLASVSGQAADPAGEAADSTATHLTEADLFAPAEEGDLGLLLPEADDPAPAAPTSTPVETLVAPPHVSPWDDELLNGSLY